MNKPILGSRIVPSEPLPPPLPEPPVAPEPPPGPNTELHIFDEKKGTIGPICRQCGRVASDNIHVSKPQIVAHQFEPSEKSPRICAVCGLSMTHIAHSDADSFDAGVQPGDDIGAETGAISGGIYRVNKYARIVKGVEIDFYDIARAFNVDDPAIAHALKRLLRYGCGSKSLEQDVEEAIWSLTRFIQYREEEDLIQAEFESQVVSIQTRETTQEEEEIPEPGDKETTFDDEEAKE
jgi:hypothetical protein